MARYRVQLNAPNGNWELVDLQDKLVVSSFPRSIFVLSNERRRYILQIECEDLNRRHDDDKLYLKEVQEYVVNGRV